MHRLASSLLAVTALAVLAAPLAAQQRGDDESDASWLESCRTGWGGDGNRGRACEVRTVPVRLAGRSIEIDGRQNGGIRVQGWDGDSVRVSARMQANADSDDEARRLLADVRISADGRGVRAEGPSSRGWDRTNWAVSYMVWVPRRFDLDLDAHNGGLRVTGVSGRMDLRTVNGSLGLVDVGGEVRARTQNGSLRVELDGTRWQGAGLDAETQNGSVRLSIPARYAAQLETGTVNGRMNTEIPLTITGRLGRRLSVPLNGGGPTIRALTTNGSVSIATR